MLVAISPEQPDTSLSTKEKNEISFEVLSDVGNKIANQFGLVFTLDEQLQPVYKEFGIDIPKSNGDTSYTLPIAATYVIDTTGEIKYAFVDTDYRNRAEPSDVIKALEAV